MLEVIYLSIGAIAAYVGLLFLWKAGPAQRTYAWLLIGNAALAGVAFGLGRSGDLPALAGLAGALSLFGFAFLVFPVPPLLRALTRRAFFHDRTRLAVWLASVRELLTPGLGARQERELIETARAVNAGEADVLLATLRARRAASADRRERQALDDRMMLILIGARRWREAIDIFEARSEEVIRPHELTLFIEIAQAYAEVGDLEGASRVVLFLERLPRSGEPDLAPHLSRARLLFLAFAGRPAAIERVLEAGAAPLYLRADARAYLLGVALRYAGDIAGARAKLAEAVSRARDRRLKTAAGLRLAALEDDAKARELSPELAAVADQIAERAAAAVAEAPPAIEGVPASATPVTVGLMVANVVAFAAVALSLGTTTQAWALARAGAHFGPAVEAGEWWRLVSCTFLHVGVLHLGINMFSLWQLGRVVEPAVGSLRTGAIYAIAGIGGSLATHFLGKNGLSAGASGAVFGVLGAAIVELALRRNSRWQRWRGALLNNLVFIAVASLGIGYVTPIIDLAAHVGGLVAGGLAALLFSRRHAFGRGRLGHALAVTVAAAALAAVVAATYGVIGSPYARTVDRIGWRSETLAGVELQVPDTWLKGNDEDLLDPIWSPLRTVAVTRMPAADLGGIVESLVRKLQADKVESVQLVPSSLAGPPGWTIHELRIIDTIDDEKSTLRETLFLRLSGHETVLVALVYPEAVIDEARPVLERVVASVRIPY